MSHAPRRRFGQNFLRDETVLRALMNAIAPGPEDRVVEIGPGRGALTQRLAGTCAELHLVEIDRDLVAELRQRYAADSGVFIHQADALKFDFRELVTDRRKLRLVGNLPYNISTPLLFHLFEQQDGVVDMHFMLQREVVQRLTADPGSADYGRLTVMSQYFCRSESLFEVSPESFFPQPKVTSAVVRLVPHQQPPVNVFLPALQKVVIAAFGQRRKTLRNSLSGLLGPETLAALAIDTGLRAQDLDLEDFARIAATLPRVEGGRGSG